MKPPIVENRSDSSLNRAIIPIKHTWPHCASTREANEGAPPSQHALFADPDERLRSPAEILKPTLEGIVVSMKLESFFCNLLLCDSDPGHINNIVGFICSSFGSLPTMENRTFVTRS